MCRKTAPSQSSLGQKEKVCNGYSYFKNKLNSRHSTQRDSLMVLSLGFAPRIDSYLI